MNKRTLKIMLLIFSVSLAASACTLLSEQNKSDNQTLYSELGGEAGVSTIVDFFIDEIGFDNIIFEHFENTEIERFRNKLTEHLCKISDGPCEYTGDEMKEVHAGMGISELTFNHTVDLLINAMDKANIKHTTQNKLLARLVPLRRDIIYQ